MTKRSASLTPLGRFDIEHTFRFVKGTLGWTAPALHPPQQADRWTRLVIAALHPAASRSRAHLRPRLPWERRCDPTKLTPARVRRGFRRLRAITGTPRPSTEIPHAGSRTPQGHLKTAPNALSGGQEGRLNGAKV